MYLQIVTHWELMAAYQWSMEYTAAEGTAMLIALATASLLIILFKMKRGNGKLYPPVAATMVEDIFNFKRAHDFMADLHRRYKTYTIAYPTFTYVCTTDPANVEHILKSNFANYVKGKFIHETMEDILGDGIFNVDGEQWRKQRKLASLEFSTRNLKDFSSVVFREKAVKLSKILLEAYNTEQTVEMQGLLLRSTMDSICKVAFGIEVNSLTNTNSGAEASFAKAFDAANTMLFWRYFDITWKLKRYFNIWSEANMKEIIKRVDDFVYKVIQSRRREISAQNNYLKPDILSRFIASTEKIPENDSDKYLRDIILSFMVAGRETTAITLSWFLHLLCKNPDVEKRILQEINDMVKVNECVSMEESLTMFAESLTHKVLEKMHYLHAALSETLRLYPAVPVDMKYVVSDDILPDGFKIKKGDMMCYLPYSMGRMTYLWGSNAEEFRPERWLKDGIFQPQSPFKFTAFQAGPRNCLGKDFAYLQMKIVAAVLVRFFKFQAVEGIEVRYCPALTLHMNEDGLNLRVNPRLDC
jgi:cytochrome P450